MTNRRSKLMKQWPLLVLVGYLLYIVISILYRFTTGTPLGSPSRAKVNSTVYFLERHDLNSRAKTDYWKRIDTISYSKPLIALDDRLIRLESYEQPRTVLSGQLHPSGNESLRGHILVIAGMRIYPIEIRGIRNVGSADHTIADSSLPFHDKEISMTYYLFHQKDGWVLTTNLYDIRVRPSRTGDNLWVLLNIMTTDGGISSDRWHRAMSRILRGEWWLQ